MNTKKILLLILTLVSTLGVCSNNPNPNSVLISGGTIDSLTASLPGCVLAYSVTVTTDVGGGTDTFDLEIWDDGVMVNVANLSAPADGTSHTLSGTLQLATNPAQNNPGIGVYLRDNGGTSFDVIDPYSDLDGCTPGSILAAPANVPTISNIALLFLTALLFLVALASIKRSKAN